MNQKFAIATHTPLFAGLVGEDSALQAELAKVAVAADLAALAALKGVSRTELARRLSWSKARVSQILGGKGNLTVETIQAVTQALGSRMEVVFRSPEETRPAQPWERTRLQLLPSAQVVHLKSEVSLRPAATARRSKAPHYTFTQVTLGIGISQEQDRAA